MNNKHLSAVSFYQDLRRYVNSKINNIEDANDIVQTIFLKIAQGYKPTNISKLKAWLWTIARNAIIDYYRKKQKHQSIPYHDTIDFTDDIASENEVSHCLIPLIKNLPETEQYILMAVDISGLSLKQYAIEKQIKYNTAKSKIHRARKNLQRILLNCCQLKFDGQGIPIEYTPKTLTKWSGNDCNSC